MKTAAALACVAVLLCCAQYVAGQAASAKPGQPICDGRLGSVAISGDDSVDGTPGCRRWTKGWDVTGTTNFQQKGVVDVCDCIRFCKQNSQTCAAWVWKYVDNTTSRGVPLRKCTIYSNLNQPPGTTLGLSASTSKLGNVGGPMPIPAAGFVQGGGFAPHCQLPPFDANGNGQGWDKNCFSGQLWAVDNARSANVGDPSKLFSC